MGPVTHIRPGAPRVPAIHRIREAHVVYRPLELTLEGRALRVGDAMRESSEYGAIARAWIGDRTQEHVIAFAIGEDLRLIAVNTVSIGSADWARLCITELLRFLVVVGAHALILAHNHPSGDVSPSPEDLALTLEVSAACSAIGMKLIDHVIVGAASRKLYSFYDERTLP